MRDPYDIAYFPKVPAYLATYSSTAVALESLVRVLFGELDPTGRLPVDHPQGGRASRRSIPSATAWSTDMSATHAPPGRPPAPRALAALAAASGSGSAGGGGTEHGRGVLTGFDALARDGYRLGRRRAGGDDHQPDRRARRPAARGRRDGRRRPGRPGGRRSVPSTASAAAPQAGGSEGDYVDQRTGVTVYDTYAEDAGADRRLLPPRPASRR